MEKNSKIGVCGSWVKIFGEINVIAKYADSHKKIVSNMFTSSPFAHPSVIFRKELLDKFNLRYNSEFKTAEDYDLWTRASKYIKFANIQKVLLNYRISSNQMTKSQETLANANKLIWKMQLENLGIDFSDDDLTFHWLLLSEKYTITNPDSFMKNSNMWIDKIIFANEEKQIYDTKILISLFKHKWYIAVKNIMEFGVNISVIDIFLDLNRFKYLSLKNRFRFLYRFLKKKLRDNKLRDSK